jgi:hypothetical protein
MFNISRILRATYSSLDVSLDLFRGGLNLFGFLVSGDSR